MIALFTDFGWQGPYVGQMKLVLHALAPAARVIDLMHDAPRFAPRPAAYLLAALVGRLPVRSVTVAVVDPGVGSTQRRPLVVEADQRWYVGPDNGLLHVLYAQARAAQCWEIDWRPATLSNTFHGRDLFAPAAARLVTGQHLEMTATQPAQQAAEWPVDLAEIIYIDGFGNAVSGLRAAALPTTARLEVGARQLRYAPTFAAVEVGTAFWTVNANGLVELAINQGHASSELGLAIGSRLGIRLS